MALRINDILKEKKLSQDALSTMLGINRVTLNRTINGNPTYETLSKIATALDVDIRDLFEPTKDADPTDPVAALKEIKRLTDVALDAQ